MSPSALTCPWCHDPVASPSALAMPGPDIRVVYCLNATCVRTWRAWECVSRETVPANDACRACKALTLRSKDYPVSYGETLELLICQACGWWAEAASERK